MISFFKSPNLKKEMFQKTILNLKFKFPPNNALLLLAENLDFKLRIVFGIFLFGDLEIWKTNHSFWKKATFRKGLALLTIKECLHPKPWYQTMYYTNRVQIQKRRISVAFNCRDELARSIFDQSTMSLCYKRRCRDTTTQIRRSYFFPDLLLWIKLLFMEFTILTLKKLSCKIEHIQIGFWFIQILVKLQ